MIPLAVAGGRPLAFVDAAGYLHRDGQRVEWWVLGDDQWHAPAATASLRQRAVDHTPVVETTIRVPGGDVVWRVGAAVEGIVVECENRAAIPIALGLARVDGDVVRDLQVFPVTHTTTWRRSLDDYDNRHVPELAAVARGWLALARQGAQVSGIDSADALTAARCSLLLHRGAPSDRGRRSAVLGAVASALTMLGYEDEASELRLSHKLKPQRRGLPLVEALDPLLTTDDLVLLADPVVAARTVAAIRAELVDDAGKTLDLAPGFAEAWRGASVDVTALPTNHGDVSFVLRWHGDKPALLWDAPVPVTARSIDPDFSSSEREGDSLLNC